MSKSFAKTPAFSPVELNAISLASGLQEQCYKGGLLGIVLLPVCFYLYQYAEFWWRAPSQYFSLENIPSITLLVGCYCALGLVVVYLVRFFLRPLNHDFVGQWLRKNEAGWWLGAGGQWQPIDLTGEVLITHWLIILRFRLDAQTGWRTVWLWQDTVGVNTHRKLRVLF